MKCFSLFSGVGGFDLALKNQGHEMVGACEIDEYARSVYTRQFPGVRVWKDATKIKPEELPDFELLCAGFPCQTFSVAGRRLGFEESRGTLFFEIARIAKQKRPRLLLLENVKGLLSHDRGRTFAEILTVLDELGYDAEWQVLNSKHWVPQNRERIFIIGYLRGTPRPEIFPIVGPGEVTDNRKATKQIARTLQHPGNSAGNYKGMNMVQVGNIDQKGNNSMWGRVYDPKGISQTLGAEGGGLGAKTGLYVIPVITPGRGHKHQNGRLFKEDGEPQFTITSHEPHGIYDGKSIRRLTPLECERLQGFPDNWTCGLSDTQRYKCCGNAVTVPVVEFIVSKL